MTQVLDNPAVGIAERGLVIGDARVTRTGGGTREMVYAGNGEVQAEMPWASTAEIDQAVAAAKAALPVWRATSPDTRGRILYRLADILERDAERLGELLVRESGRTITESVQEVHQAASWTRYFAGWTDKLDGRVVPTQAGVEGLNYVVYEPYGVVAVLPPYNVGFLSQGMKTAPAIAAGNTVVVKPSDLTPFTAVAFAEAALEAGMPPGVINVVTGGPVEGDYLVRHPDVAKVTFTGGTPTARKILTAAADLNKPVTLELGGKGANIVFPDADLDKAAPFALVVGALAATGQGCILGTRLFVHDDIYDEMEQRLIQLSSHFAVGDPMSPATQLGAVVSEGHRDRIMGVIDRAKAEGAGRLVFGGDRADRDGYFINATLFGDVDNDSHLAQEEVFGPVLSMLRFRTEEEVIAKANNIQYGLTNYIQTRDVARAHRVAAQLESGTVSVNGISGLSPAAPFGGVKRSGLGTEGGYTGIMEFVHPKSIFIGN
ncbi:aldehyde dehydrogenase family protein [Microbacterium laevaniformans]|uniref:aldehyde dehydrogenase family protein n=1 Tax=Microbacterium laevaniformans TaxID=36807 RepID=UPI00362CB2C3